MPVASERELGAAFFAAVQVAIPKLKLFRRQIVTTRIDGRYIKAGVRGQADFYGYLRGGKAIEIELKGPKGVVSQEQLDWETFCREWGILYMRLSANRGEFPGATVARWVTCISEFTLHF